MTKKKVVFIVNPFSGTTAKISTPELIKNKLDKVKFDWDIVFTEYAGHAIKLSERAKNEGADIVVAVGGDGSVNEVAQPLVGSKISLGILPGGSGNGFAMHLGLGRNTEKAIDYLNTSSVLSIDTCTVNDRFFANVAGVGFDARIAYKTKQNKKRGFLPYLTTSIGERNKFEPTKIRMIIDGQEVTGKYAAAVIANASMYGYHFTISPVSSLQDGMMDVMLIRHAPMYRYILESYRFLNRTLHKSKITETYQGSDIKIYLEKADYIHVDGEGYKSDTELHFKLLPKSLNVLVPPNTNLKRKL